MQARLSGRQRSETGVCFHCPLPSWALRLAWLSVHTTGGANKASSPDSWALIRIPNPLLQFCYHVWICLFGPFGSFSKPQKQIWKCLYIRRLFEGRSFTLFLSKHQKRTLLNVIFFFDVWSCCWFIALMVCRLHWNTLRAWDLCRTLLFRGLLRHWTPFSLRKECFPLTFLFVSPWTMLLQLIRDWN